MDQHHVEYITEKALAVTTQEIEQEPGSVCGVPLLFLFFIFFIAVATRLLIPQTLRLLMSKSMCGCGCSIISSLMKRLGRTACCSDLFPSHTSEQLQRLATGCAPQPKVTARTAPTHPPIQPHRCPLASRSASFVRYVSVQWRKRRAWL